ncbi:MAG: YfhO family protein [Armatimonadetes bacterium]|nr:YfhO family protein [Armatimonadota bacterium]
MRPLARAQPILFLALLPLAFFSSVLFSDRVLLPGGFLQQIQPFAALRERAPSHPNDEPSNWNALQWDALAQYYPWRLYAKQSLRRNEIPLWNPHEFCGSPFVANGQSAVFYPFNLLFWVLPTAVAFGWSAALHVFLAGAFMFAFARTMKLSTIASLVASMSFMFCGFVVTWLELPTLVNVAVWFPLLCLLLEKCLRSPTLGLLSLLAVVTGVQFLAGHFQVSFYLLLLVGLRVLWELGGRLLATKVKGANVSRELLPLGAVSLALLLGFGLAAIQIAPTAELARHSHRAGHPTVEGYRWYVANAMPWEHLGTLFIPDLYGNPTRSIYVGPGSRTGGAGSYTEFCGYVGFLPMVLSLMSFPYLRKTRSGFYGFLMAFSLLVALGTPVASLLYFHAPGFSQMGGFSRILVLFCFSASFLAGVGWEHAVQPGAQTARRSLIVLGGIALLGCLFAYLVARSAFFGEANLSSSLATLPTGAEPALWLPWLWLILAFAFSFEKISRPAFNMLSLAIVATDLFSFGVGFNPSAPREAIYPKLNWTQAAEPRARSLSVSEGWSLYQFPDATLPPNGPMAYGLYDIQGYDSLQTRQYKALASRLERNNPTPVENGNMLLLRNVQSPWINVLGVRYVLSATPLLSPCLRMIRESPLFVYENPRRYPPAFVVDSFPSPEEVERGIVFRPAALLTYSSLKVEIKPPQVGGYLMLTDAHFPGWRVFLEGREATPLLWAEALRAVRLPEHPVKSVAWVYLPATYRLGAFLSCASLMVLSGVMSCKLFRETRNFPSEPIPSNEV